MSIRVMRRLWPLLLLFLILFIFYYFRINQYVNFTTLQANHQKLITWTNAHYLTAVMLFMVCYILSVATSMPVALILTLSGGLLFGVYWGTIYVVISATLGATILFFAVKIALSDWVAQRTTIWVNKMRIGFQKNAFSYLLILRLIPLFPFWAVNIVPALLGVSANTFIITTFLGIIPGSVIYVSLGNSLNHFFSIAKTPNLKIIFEPAILLPLIGLALLSMSPIIYQKFKDKNEHSDPM